MKPRAFRIHDRAALQRCAALLSQMPVSEDRPLLVEVSEWEEKKTRQQENYFHALLGEVALNVYVNGQKFGKPAWKEHYCRMFLPLHDITLPTGEIVQQRQSTKDLSVGEYAKLIDQTLADLASEHGYLPEALAA